MSQPDSHELPPYPGFSVEAAIAFYEQAPTANRSACPDNHDTQDGTSSEFKAKTETGEADANDSGNPTSLEPRSRNSAALDGSEIVPIVYTGYINQEGSGMHGATEIEPASQEATRGVVGGRAGGDNNACLALRLFRHRYPTIFMVVIVFTVLSIVAVIILALAIGLGYQVPQTPASSA